MHITTRAKVNLHLDVIRRRRDGYHEIETIFQTVDLADEIEIEFTSDARVEIECDDPEIPTDARNLCHKAIVAMREFAGGQLGARINLHKKIPTGAGLGGGSSNAAGIIHAVNTGLQLDLGVEKLESIGARLGSDVPFMLHGGTMLGRGRGEILTPLTALSAGLFLIVKPDLSISTAEVYANCNIRLTKHKPRINLRAVDAALARVPGANLSFSNALEDVVCPSYPVVAGILEELLFEKPCFASMSGSGSALYAIMSSAGRAATLAERFSARGLFTSVVEPAKRAVDIN